MLKILFIIITSLLLTTSVRSQDYLSVSTDYMISYQFSYVTNPEMGERTSGDSYLLLGGKDTSFFISFRDYFNDSIGYEFEQQYGKVQDNWELANKLLFSIVPPSSKSKLRSIKFHDKNTANVISPKIGIHNYMETSTNFEWEIGTERDTILNFMCYKATTKYGGRSYIAWFTPEIPISDGPYVFKGLPGLILRLAYSENNYQFRAYGISHLRKTVQLNSNYKNPYKVEVSRQEYVEEAIKMKNNPSFHPGRMNVTPEMKVKLKKSYEKRYDLLIERNN